MTFLSLVDSQYSSHYIEMLLHTYILSSYKKSSVYTLLYSCQKIYLKQTGVYMKVIAHRPCWCFPQTCFTYLTFKVSGLRQGETPRRNASSTRTTKDLFSLASLQWKRFHLCNSEDMQYTLNVRIQVCTTALLINTIII